MSHPHRLAILALPLLLCACGVRSKPLNELSDSEIRQAQSELDPTEAFLLMMSSHKVPREQMSTYSINELIGIGREVMEDRFLSEPTGTSDTSPRHE